MQEYKKHENFSLSDFVYAVDMAGAIYGATAAVCGVFVVLAWRPRRAGESDRRPAHRLFGFSIVYLFALFPALCSATAAGNGQPFLPRPLP